MQSATLPGGDGAKSRPECEEVLAFGHRWSVTAFWLTSNKACGERDATPRFAERLHMDCARLLRARLWKLMTKANWAGRAVEYRKQLNRKQLNRKQLNRKQLNRKQLNRKQLN